MEKRESVCVCVGGVLCYRKLIHKTTPLSFFDKTSVAKGQGDLRGEASKEKDTG